MSLDQSVSCVRETLQTADDAGKRQSLLLDSLAIISRYLGCIRIQFISISSQLLYH